jgi:hypothetical protein
MKEFSAADFAPLDDFPLLGRWTRRSHDLLPAAALATIRPLTRAAAAALAPEAANRCSERPAFELELSISAEWDDGEPVRERLWALGIPHDERVILSWTRELAVETRWETFVQHWDAFCYPSSDDVTVWARHSDWTLCYRHFQFIEFSRSPPAT